MGSQAEFPPQIVPQVELQSPQVVQEALQVASLHPKVAHPTPQVELQAVFVPQNGSKVVKPSQLVVQPSCWMGGRFPPNCGRVAHSAKEMLALEASIIAAARAVYFLNIVVHLQSITVVLRTVTLS